ncbi:hypothetical protein [Parapedobacter soli]|uniref:hypothetical protein n=1 Tax=Parapedobacter soli TaxID=416955 RepID=UPI0021C92806|nr:hypothetical protein [Parapedobacter soli]
MTETIFDVGDVAVTAGVEAPPEAPETEAVRKPDSVPQFSFYGQNKREYLFLTDEQQHEWMSEPAMDAFVKTLAALKLTVDDVAVLNLAKLKEPPLIDHLTSVFKPKVVVNLGTSLAWPEQGGVKVFHTSTFDAMLADAEKKRVFWTTIKMLLI